MDSGLPSRLRSHRGRRVAFGGRLADPHALSPLAGTGHVTGVKGHPVPNGPVKLPTSLLRFFSLGALLALALVGCGQQATKPAEAPADWGSLPVLGSLLLAALILGSLVLSGKAP